ncbi:MAG: NAD-dependent DNA ligase LigA [Bacteriovoracia bacterium]
MNKSKRIGELEKLIKKHKALYYTGNPEITDYEYDQLEEELKQLDPQNYTLNLVGTAVRGQDKIAHDKKMLSLQKTYDFDELVRWQDGRDLVSTFKIDGISCSLIYEENKLILAKTRGDGRYGENITAKVQWIDSIPKKLEIEDNIEVRGEIFCREDKFLALADNMNAQGLEKPTSQRNIVAGLIGRKDHINLCKFLDFVAFEVISESEKLQIEKEIEKYPLMQSLGFALPKYDLVHNKEELKSILNSAQDHMNEGEFQIDGVVFSFNDLEMHRMLGETSHHPRYKMAFKFQGLSQKTTIKTVDWNVSRNGVLTPVALVEPVEVSGATISRVTLHNYAMVKQFDLKKGDTIEIIRSGDVIPKFMGVVERDQHNKVTFPHECPSCHGKVLAEDIRLICPNPDCPAQLKEQVLNFIQKIGIDDLGIRMLEELLNRGMVKSISDLYKLNVEDFLTLEKTKETLAKKLYNNIQKSKNTTLVQFLAALGIRGGAYNKCEKIIAAGYDSIEKIKNLDYVDLENIESFAGKSAKEFLDSLRAKHELIDELLDQGFVLSSEVFIKSEGPLKDKKLVITGELSRKRSEVATMIKEAGGQVTGSVSSNTDYLVTNERESNSSKYKKAKKLNVAIINENMLYHLIQTK